MERQISVRLPARLLQQLTRQARLRKVPRSRLIREILQSFLETGSTERPYDRVRDLVGSLAGGPPDLGERHREHLAEMIRDRR
jgi:metal-responsive CopG/Arc/MetJ family transcriptional regulator